MLKCLLESSCSFLVITVLVDFECGAGFEEVGEIFEGLGFRVEGNYAFHELGVLVPIGCLEEVGCQDPSLWGAGVVGEGYDLVGITQLDQTFQCSLLVGEADVQIGSRLETALFPAFLSKQPHQLYAFVTFDWIGGLLLRHQSLN
jgi:hypothetical protein